MWKESTFCGVTGSSLANVATQLSSDSFSAGACVNNMYV
jgi:hypothetical protein